MVELSDRARGLIDGPNLGFLATVMPDGSPQVSPVWIDRDGDLVLVNTAPGRLKEQNMRRDARVAISVADRDDPYEKVDIRGRVVDWVDGDEAVAHIDSLERKYRGNETYPLPEGQQRLIARIEPHAVFERT